MCQPATCFICGKTTWAGCGQHVDQVMAGVPRAERCTGHADQAQDASDQAQDASAQGRVLGRR